MSFIEQTSVQFVNNGSIDAFGRLRVSTPQTLFDSKQLYDKQPTYYDEVVNATATSTHSTTNAATTMTVNASGDYVIRQTKQRFNYQPGKSQLILCTFNLGTATANTTKRVGYFNTSTVAPYTANIDGLYLEFDGTTYNLCQAKNGTVTSIPRSSWNDPMNGTGASGVNIDFTKCQILFIDFEWLGVGRVRMGFVIDGNIYYAHNFNNANNVTSVYASSPNHSIRYEIRSTGGVTSMDHICSSVMSEGGEQLTGTVRSVNTGVGAANAITGTSIGTRYALIGLQLKTTHSDSTVFIEGVSLLCGSGANFAWEAYLNPTVAGTFTYTDVTNSSLQVAIGDKTASPSTTTVTGGTLIGSGYVSSAGNEFQTSLPNNLRIGSTIAGVRDTIVLCVAHFLGNETYYASVSWRELL
jgi:hypothetical protein